MTNKPIPIVDIFAGPGGLSEGFSSVFMEDGKSAFKVKISIEKDTKAFQTLRMRSFFRSFEKGKAPDSYYNFLKGNISETELRKNKYNFEAWQVAENETLCATLGETPETEIDQRIASAIGNTSTWVLIGGPPCQAYSLAGRSRMRGTDPEAFETDKRHFLYKEYLRIIQKFKPAVFVMENVKGILSSTHKGNPIFEQICNDLSLPSEDLEYEIRSFVTDKKNLEPKDFIIQSENYAIPQKRHRVILFGIRKDRTKLPHKLLTPRNFTISVSNALAGLPKIRSRISKGEDSFEHWLAIFDRTISALGEWKDDEKHKLLAEMGEAKLEALKINSFGAKYIPVTGSTKGQMPEELEKHLLDPLFKGVCQHESRSHMQEDLQRYLFSACYAKIYRISPNIGQFPIQLWPNHKNLNAEEVPFGDRFRLQCADAPSTTVVSHISKDGHYYIHPDPSQCRSLTLREAARLQTFPDNYLFMGNKTEQYVQVGNAVPPYLAKQIAEIVRDFLTQQNLKE